MRTILNIIIGIVAVLFLAATAFIGTTLVLSIILKVNRLSDKSIQPVGIITFLIALIGAVTLIHLIFKRGFIKGSMIIFLICNLLVMISLSAIVVGFTGTPLFDLVAIKVVLPRVCNEADKLQVLPDKGKYFTICNFSQDPFKLLSINSSSSGSLVDNNDFATPDQIKEFKSWSSSKGVSLQGISRNANFLAKNRFNPDVDGIDLDNIQGTYLAYLGLRILPDNVLEVMRGKTIYFSTVYLNDISHPGAAPIGSYRDKSVNNLNVGFLLSRPISEENTLHEFGHILDFYGIEGDEGQDLPEFRSLNKEYERIFDTSGISPVPDDQVFKSPTIPGYISNYSRKNRYENFAEHFSYYVWQGKLFRERMKNDKMLAEKYNFFKDKVFLGKEY